MTKQLQSRPPFFLQMVVDTHCCTSLLTPLMHTDDAHCCYWSSVQILFNLAYLSLVFLFPLLKNGFFLTATLAFIISGEASVDGSAEGTNVHLRSCARSLLFWYFFITWLSDTVHLLLLWKNVRKPGELLLISSLKIQESLAPGKQSIKKWWVAWRFCRVL